MIKVTCPSGHKFPVNLEKNTNRDHVFCPKCMAKVVVRKKHFFSPSLTWDKEKEELKATREGIRARGRRPTPKFTSQEAQAFKVGRASSVLGLLALSKLVKKREEEKKLEQERESGRVQTEE